MAEPEPTPAVPEPTFITTALRDVSGWLAAFDAREIPVQESTAECLEEWRGNEDAADAHLLADSLGGDPLMTLKLLRHVAALRRGRDEAEAETVTEALVMLGITPFFRDFGPQPTLEQRLLKHADALDGLRQVLRRARRAAHFALGFAVHRGDHDAAVIYEAALLHDFAEMLLWVHAPAMALAIRQRQQDEPGKRSIDAQRAQIHIELGELQQALMKAWGLPDLLVQISDDHSSPSAKVRNVQLAIRLARHSAQGWDNPALPDDVDEIAHLLNLGIEPTLSLLHDLDD